MSYRLAADKRLSSLDTIRGFALLGILGINIVGFAQPYQSMPYPTLAGGFDGVNFVLWCLALWPGDILYSYGVTGLLLFALRKVAAAPLIAGGFVLLAVFSDTSTRGFLCLT